MTAYLVWKQLYEEQGKERAVTTVIDIVFGTGHCFWDSRYLCYFSTEMAEILFPGTSRQNQQNFSSLLYCQSYANFSGNHFKCTTKPPIT